MSVTYGVKTEEREQYQKVDRKRNKVTRNQLSKGVRAVAVNIRDVGVGLFQFSSTF